MLTAHIGYADADTSQKLKDAGISQALVDVMGDDETAIQIYHLNGLERVIDTLKGIALSGLEFIPHIVTGLYYGKIRSEYSALKIISHYKPKSLIFVVSVITIL